MRNKSWLEKWDSPQLNQKLNLIRMDDLFINEMLTPWKWRYMYLCMYIYVCVSTDIPPTPQRRWGKWERSEKAKGLVWKKDIYLMKITTALSILSTTHSKLIRSPHFHENWNLELNVCLHLCVPNSPSLHSSCQVPTCLILFVMGKGDSLHFKVFFKCT